MTDKLLAIHNLSIHQIGPINLALSTEECVLLHGASGAGKSLLLRAIADIETNIGDILLNNQRRETIPAPVWRQQVGLLPAESAWWYESVGEHFLGTPHALLNRLGFSNDAMNYAIHRLSSGEKQRLALLRLLEKKPRVLLLDEASANLDAENTQAVENLIHDYLQENQAAAIWVSHSAEQRQRLQQRCATRIFEVREGGLHLATESSKA